MRQFDEVRELNPYEYVSWKDWSNSHSNNKEATIEAHNIYLDDYKLIKLSGFGDDGTVQLGQIKKDKEVTDYSEFTLNEFITTHYTIEGQENAIFEAVLGPLLETHIFITKTHLEGAGKRVADEIKYDMLRFMTAEAAKKILLEYTELTTSDKKTPPW
jgi:hypothetical protein